jgi:hypothetical protein
MARRARLWFLLASVCLCSLHSYAADVLSYHNNQQSTGQNLAETKLTPSSVNVANFQRRFVFPVDGQVYAQPLYKASVQITAPGQVGAHPTVFVATQHGSVYAVDSLTGDLLWKTSLLTDGLPNATSITSVPNADVGSDDINPEIAIVSTPVIDPATNSLYATCKTKQIISGDTSLPRYAYTIFSLSIQNGAILASHIIGATYKPDVYVFRTDPDPSVPQDPFVFGTGDGAQDYNGQSRVYFNALRQMNRPGLLLLDGQVYAAFASHGDSGPYHGWLLAFDAATLDLARVFNTTPNGGLGGVWQAGGIPVVDPQGYIYFSTGNGTFDGGKDGNGQTIGLDANGLPLYANYGNCFLKLIRDINSTQADQNPNGWGLALVDYFSPYNTADLNNKDADLGSGGLMILPDEVGSAAHPRLLMGGGKEGKMYLLDRDNLGKFDGITDHVVQTQVTAVNGCANTPAYLDHRLYIVGSYYDYARIFTLSNGAIGTTALSQAVRGFSFPGATPSISANGLNNAIIWMLERSSNELRAYDSNDFSSELWTSGMAPNNRDQLGTVVKFTVPTVADGLVFVGTMNSLVVYGPPAPPQTPPAAPTGLTATAASGLQVNLSWIDHANNEDGFLVEQSKDGVNFTQIATLGVNENAVAVNKLEVGTFYYFRVRAYNMFNGTATYSAYSNIAGVATESQPPTLDYSGGFTGSGTVLNFVGDAQLAQDGTIWLTSPSGTGVGGFWTKAARNAARFTTSFTFRASGSANGLTFCLQRLSPSVLGDGGGGLGYAGLRRSVAVKFDLEPNQISTTGLYTTGVAPTEDTHAIDVTNSGIDFHSGHLFQVMLTYNKNVLTETITDTEGVATFTTQYKINIPATIGDTVGYFGFTGADSDGLGAVQVVSWTYAPLPAAPPPAPPSLVVRPASGTQLNLTWRDPSKNEAGFIIQRRTPPAVKFATIGVVGPNITTYSDSGLTPLVPYDYVIRATNAAGFSLPSPVVRGRTPTPPLTPSNATAAAPTAKKIALTWHDNANNEDRYTILRKTGAAEFRPIVNLPPNTRAYNDFGTAEDPLLPNTTYDYHIQAHNVAGYSDFTGVTVTTPAQ